MPNDYAFRDGRLVRARRRRSQARGRHGSQRPRRSSRWWSPIRSSPVRTTIESLEQNGIAYALYNRVRVEPSDGIVPRHDRVRTASSRSIRSSPSAADRRSIREGEPLHDVFAGRFPRLRQSTDWQRPAGARSVEHADGDPDAAGTGSETTGIAIFDYKKLRAKIGIVNRRLKPTLGYLDPENTGTIPPAVAASTGFDILSHAIGSLTTIRYTERPLPVIVTNRVADRSCSTSHEMTGAKRFTSSRTACGTVRDRPMDWERNGGSVAVCGPGAAAPWRQTKGAT